MDHVNKFLKCDKALKIVQKRLNLQVNPRKLVLNLVQTMFTSVSNML